MRLFAINHKFVGYFVLEYLLLYRPSVILRCFFLVHTSVTQVKVELLEMAKGAEVEELQTRLLEISKWYKTLLEALFASTVESVISFEYVDFSNPGDWTIQAR